MGGRKLTPREYIQMRIQFDSMVELTKLLTLANKAVELYGDMPEDSEELVIDMLNDLRQTAEDIVNG